MLISANSASLTNALWPTNGAAQRPAFVILEECSSVVFNLFLDLAWRCCHGSGETM